MTETTATPEAATLPNLADLRELVPFVHNWAKGKGWWQDENRPFGEQMANFHSELSEAWEEFRQHGMDPEKFLYTVPTAPSPEKPEGIAAELADAIIRICDTCGRYNIPLVEAIEQKMAYNQKRPYRHGNKHA